MNLVHQGLLHREPRGLWRITPEGRTYLEKRWPSWEPRYSDEVLPLAPEATVSKAATWAIAAGATSRETPQAPENAAVRRRPLWGPFPGEGAF